MTHIVIHQNSKVREGYLLKLLEKITEKKFPSLEAAETNPDIHLLRYEEGSIGIEQVKELQKEMVFQPFQEKAQVAIITAAQHLTVEAQNALLKTLEDQPASTEYILLVNNERNLLDTIVSRGIKHFVKAANEEKKNAPTTKPPILEMDLVDGFNEIEKIVKEGDIEELLDSLQQYLREQLKDSLRSGKDASEYKLKIEKVITAKTRLKANGNKRLVLENMILHIIEE